MPAPSPTTKPSRPASKGRLARSGSSLRVEERFHRGESADAHRSHGRFGAAAIITSASPRWIILKESPMACAEAEQAVAVAEFGPFAP